MTRRIGIACDHNVAVRHDQRQNASRGIEACGVFAYIPVEGSFLEAGEGHLAARKQWLAGHMRCAGELHLDDGAVEVLQNKNASLLPVGVKQVKGLFNRGEVVACMDLKGSEIARGLVNYASDECKLIIGKPSKQIPQILGYEDDPELINRENMILSSQT